MMNNEFDDPHAMSRRRFIRGCAIGASALTFTPLLGCRELSQKSPSAAQMSGGAPAAGNRLL
jgi:hypothetical protein